MVASSSSRISRRSASSCLSDASTLPPGNSHIPSRCVPRNRLVIRTVSPDSMTAATTTIELFGGVEDGADAFGKRAGGERLLEERCLAQEGAAIPSGVVRIARHVEYPKVRLFMQQQGGK